MAVEVNSRPFTILVEGNTGSGKTTFLKYFEKFNNICVLQEPVDKWRDCAGFNLLDLRHKEPEKWAIPFQFYVALTRLNIHKQKTNKNIKIIERSLYSARYCFVENLYKTNSLHKGMYKILQDWYDYIDSEMKIKVDLIIYLRTNPKIVYERMKIRGRIEESTVQMKYLEELHNMHENWLIKGNFHIPAPVLVLNANLDSNDIIEEYKKVESYIKNYENHEINPISKIKFHLKELIRNFLIKIIDYLK